MKSSCAATPTYVTKLKTKEKSKLSVTELASPGSLARASGSRSSSILNNNNKEVSARRIDVDVALHASASYYCGFFARKLQQEHVDDAGGGDRILDRMMN